MQDEAVTKMEMAFLAEHIVEQLNARFRMVGYGYLSPAILAFNVP